MHFGHFAWIFYKLDFQSELSVPVKYFRKLFRSIFMSVPTEDFWSKVLKSIFWPKIYRWISKISEILRFYVRILLIPLFSHYFDHNTLNSFWSLCLSFLQAGFPVRNVSTGKIFQEAVQKHIYECSYRGFLF